MTTSQSQPGPDHRVVNLIRQKTEEFAQISEKLDHQAFAQNLHDDWFMVDANGQVFTKQQELDLLRGSDFKVSSLRVQDLHVTVHGDTAVVTGISNIQANHQNQDISGRYRFVQVWKAPGANLLGPTAAALPNNYAMINCVTFSLANTVDPAPKPA
jgi:ketosteroid isomerase-like protein